MADRLARWYVAVENACLKAEMELDKLAIWQGRSAAATGADKATARRNINVFAKLGLIREITGQGRYRVWAELGSGARNLTN